MRISEIVQLLKEYIILGIVAIIFLGLLFFIGYKIIYQKILKGKKTISRKNMLLYGITICYAIIVFGAVFLSRGGGYYGEANFHLFNSYREAYHKMEISLFRNIILNILLFVPLGFLLPMYSKKLKKIYKVVSIGFLITVLIETMQYITKIGIFEIDDIFNNTIGVLIGYCIYMILNNLKTEQNRKYIFAYVIPGIAIISIFIGIYLKYQKQELGNLPFEYNYKINMKNINIESKVQFSNERSSKEIYYVKTLTEEDTRKLAENIFEKLETTIDERRVDIYENTAIYYSSNQNYSIWVNYKGGTYSYTNFSKISEDNEETNSQTEATKIEPNIKTVVTREEIETALQKLGIEIPQSAKFEEKESNYIFSVDMELEKNYLIDGNITCSYSKNGTIKNMKNNLIRYEKVKDKEIISQEEAYNQIKEGKFQYFDDEKIASIEIDGVELKYALDSKGYYVPIYVFDAKINNQETLLQVRAIK